MSNATQIKSVFEVSSKYPVQVLSEENFRHHQQLLRNTGQVHFTDGELLKPPSLRFAPLAYKTKTQKERAPLRSNFLQQLKLMIWLFERKSNDSGKLIGGNVGKLFRLQLV